MPFNQVVTVAGANVAAVNFELIQNCPCSLWSNTTVPTITAVADPNPIEVGVRFRSDVAGNITALKFYKGATNTGTHIGNLWGNDGTLLATATFTGETASGWQQVNLSTPVAIAANTTYVASYNTTVGDYSADPQYFANPYDNEPLHAPQDGTAGGNGLFLYGAGGFPTNTSNSTNYWVDVVFSPTGSFGISGSMSGYGGAGATMTLSGSTSATVTADASGNYSFASLPNGVYIVTPSKVNSVFTPGSQTVVVNGASVTGVNFSVQTIPGGALAIDVTASKDSNTAAKTIATAAFSTTAANELLLAFISADAPTTGTNTTVSSIAGGSLTWVLAERSNTQRGTAEVWRAFAPTVLTNATVTATLSAANAASITVVTFKGADPTGTSGSGAIGAVNSTNSAKGAPTASLTTTRNNSWVFGVGVDWDNATARTVGPSQTMVHQYLAPIGDAYWVQRQTAVTPTSGTSVTINDTAPTTDRYNLAIVEVRSALNAVSGTITNGAGATVALSGCATATTTADASGNYSFSGVPNGTCTITPTLLGFGMSPTNWVIGVNEGNATGVNFTATAMTWTISGTVAGAGGNAATVTLSGGASATVTADASGNYSFTGLVNGAYTVTPSKTGFAYTPGGMPVTVSNASMTGVNFSTITYTVSGTISGPGGNAATVSLGGAATATVTADASGNYSFTGLVNGAYTVTPSHTGFAFTPVSQPVTVNGANVSAVNFTSSAGTTYTLSGTITGTGNSGATVQLSGAGSGSTTTDASGNYTFTGLLNGVLQRHPQQGWNDV